VATTYANRSFTSTTSAWAASYLRDIPVAEIFEIRYRSAAQAQIKWGPGHMQGVIQVVNPRAAPNQDTR
jgi:hypothetical protein